MTAQATSSQPAPRLYYLDVLRVIAILIVFLFHSVHPFDLWGWHVKNIQQSLTLTVFMTILSMWGMPFFFLVAGAGSWFALRRRSAKQYAVERTKRLLVPYIFCTIVVFFLTQYFEWENGLYRGVVTITFAQYLAAGRDWYLSEGFSPVWWGLGAHLWFLGFLYSFAILSLPLFFWLKGENGKRFLGWLARICEVRGGILLFLVPLLLIRFLLTPLFPTLNDWSDFIYLGSFFVLGFILFAHDGILKAVRRDGWLLGAIGMAAITCMLALFLAGQQVQLWVGWFGKPEFYIAVSIVVVVSLAWSVAMISFGMRKLNIDKPWVRYANDLVLPFFIVHQPVILVIASFVVKWNTGIPLKMLVVVPASFFITWGICEFIVKRVGFLRFLFGMTSPKPAEPKERRMETAHVG
jgi:peptidoglycan/LPS O-acetylase OafA/YrhL